jgi:hypothetical protein
LLTKLIDAGIDPDLIPRCDDYRFGLVENMIYEINDSFPKLTADSFKESALPAQVVSLNYQIDLTSTPPSPIPVDQIQDVYQQLTSGERKSND